MKFLNNFVICLHVALYIVIINTTLSTPHMKKRIQDVCIFDSFLTKQCIHNRRHDKIVHNNYEHECGRTCDHFLKCHYCFR